jgi:hypothetical protein
VSVGHKDRRRPSQESNGLVCTLASTISTLGIVLTRLNRPIWKLWPRASRIDCDCQVSIIGEPTKGENASKERGQTLATRELTFAGLPCKSSHAGVHRPLS